MLLADGKGVLLEYPDRIDEAKFLALAVAEFPSLADEFAEEEGFFHTQMAAFSRLAQDAIERGDFATLQRCYKLADETLKSAPFSVVNAIYVSFLENLNFESSPHGAKAEGLLSPKLTEALAELNEHWRKVNEWLVQQQDEQQQAREENARKK